jgi:hypothetical protein
MLPVLLTARLGSSARRRGLGGRFMKSVLWVFLFQAAWSSGEFAGYLRGASGKSKIF